MDLPDGRLRAQAPHVVLGSERAGRRRRPVFGRRGRSGGSGTPGEKAAHAERQDPLRVARQGERRRAARRRRGATPRPRDAPCARDPAVGRDPEAPGAARDAPRAAPGRKLERHGAPDAAVQRGEVLGREREHLGAREVDREIDGRTRDRTVADCRRLDFEIELRSAARPHLRAVERALAGGPDLEPAFRGPHRERVDGAARKPAAEPRERRAVARQEDAVLGTRRDRLLGRRDAARARSLAAAEAEEAHLAVGADREETAIGRGEELAAGAKAQIPHRTASEDAARDAGGLEQPDAARIAERDAAARRIEGERLALAHAGQRRLAAPRDTPARRRRAARGDRGEDEEEREERRTVARLSHEERPKASRVPEGGGAPRADFLPRRRRVAPASPAPPETPS